ncbi:MAG: endo-1,4-beta-xylanase [Verrucomicrobiae bacterium]|nr:endo-1,4-beta-xylanase [Verrucomicrobiae bacterium]
MKHLPVPLSLTFVLFIGSARAQAPESFSRLWNDPAVAGRIERDIEKHRKGDATIEVVGSDGNPLANATVEVRQQTHEFLFGCNLFVLDQLATPELNRKYEAAFTNLFNFATLPFYWPAYEPQRGRPAHERTEKIVQWCAARGIVCKGHPLVWDFRDPHWLPRDFEEIRRLSHERVTDCIRRFAGKIDRWDVVNEPTHLGRFGTRLGEWAQSLGAVPYVRQHLETARAAGPNATLLVNDYRVDPAYYQILDQLRAGGKLMFDVVGIQSHMHHGVWPLEKVWRVCDAYARLGLPIHFTETTIVSGAFLGKDPKRKPNAFSNEEMWGETTPELEARQAEQVGRFYTALFAHPAVHAITWWDFSDAHAWKRAAAGWLRKDMSPKPAYEKLRELIKGRWWSKFDGATDAEGRLRARLYYGDYKATITLPNGAELKKTLSWPRHAERNLVVTF